MHPIDASQTLHRWRAQSGALSLSAAGAVVTIGRQIRWDADMKFKIGEVRLTYCLILIFIIVAIIDKYMTKFGHRSIFSGTLEYFPLALSIVIVTFCWLFIEVCFKIFIKNR